jgi:predicted DNA-binding ribbon-helix-helix protein
MTRSQRTLVVFGKRTRLRLEPEFWQALDDIGRRETLSLSDLVTYVRQGDPGRPASSSLRVFVATYFRRMAECSAAEAARRLQ